MHRGSLPNFLQFFRKGCRQYHGLTYNSPHIIKQRLRWGQQWICSYQYLLRQLSTFLTGAFSSPKQLGLRWKPSAVRYSDDSSEVPEIGQSNFRNYINQHENVFVFFYDPYCSHCQKVMPEFEKFYEALKNDPKLGFATVDGPRNQALCMEQGIDSFPTIRLYTSRGGGLRFLDISNLKKKSELAAFYKAITSGSSESLKPQQKRFYSRSVISTTQNGVDSCLRKGAVELTDANFRENIGNYGRALVLFYTTWCTDCIRAFSELSGIMDSISSLQCTLILCNGEKCVELVDKFYVREIPTVKYFRNGKHVTNYVGRVQCRRMIKFIENCNESKCEGDLNSSQSSTNLNPLVFVPQMKKDFWKDIQFSDKILNLNNDNFDETLKKHNSLMVLFYACWNKTCVNLRKDYANLSNCDGVLLGAIDCEDNTETADKYGIIKFPTIKYFRNGKFVANYLGEYNDHSILKFLSDPSKLQIVTEKPQIMKLICSPPGVPSYWRGVSGGECIHHVNDCTIEEVLKQHPAFLLMFYLTWCRSCSVMKQEYGIAAKTLDSSIGQLGACDAVENNETTDKYVVLKLPTIKYFRNGEFVKDFKGTRTAVEIIDFMKRNYSPIIPTQTKGPIEKNNIHK